MALSPFIVLALPRSRTAWLAAYLTYREQFLIGHDIVVGCSTMEDFLNSFKNGMVGTVETGAVLAWRLIRHKMPEAKLVTVHRPIGEVVDSLRRLGVEPDLREMEGREAMLQLAAKAPGVESLSWRDLDDPEVMKWMLNWLLDCPFDVGWHQRMMSLNIQINFTEQMKRIWERREVLEGLRVEVMEATKKLPEETRAWMG